MTYHWPKHSVSIFCVASSRFIWLTAWWSHCYPVSGCIWVEFHLALGVVHCSFTPDSPFHLLTLQCHHPAQCMPGDWHSLKLRMAQINLPYHPQPITSSLLCAYLAPGRICRTLVYPLFWGKLLQCFHLCSEVECVSSSTMKRMRSLCPYSLFSLISFTPSRFPLLALKINLIFPTPYREWQYTTKIPQIFSHVFVHPVAIFVVQQLKRWNHIFYVSNIFPIV